MNRFSEFNYKRNAQGKCVLVEGASPLESNDQCTWDQPFWYERTPLRKVPHSKCEGGLALDQGFAHACPGNTSHSFFFWATITIAPFLIAGLAAIWWTRRRGGGGRIRLPEAGEGGNGNLIEVLASVPWFLIGVIGVVVGYLKELEIPWVSDKIRRKSRSGYRTLRLDDDAELLQEEGLDDYED